jgi:hypothetical protein
VATDSVMAIGMANDSLSTLHRCLNRGLRRAGAPSTAEHALRLGTESAQSQSGGTRMRVRVPRFRRDTASPRDTLSPRLTSVRPALTRDSRSTSSPVLRFLGFMLDYPVRLGLSAVGRNWCGRSRYRRATLVLRGEEVSGCHVPIATVRI